MIERVVIQAPEIDYTARNQRRGIAYRIAVPGAIVLAVGIGFGVKAAGDHDKATSTPELCDATLVCNQQGKDLIDSARTNARIADVGIVLGVAALATAVIVFAMAPGGTPKESRPAMRVVPTGLGVAVVGHF